jgi:hypothetical protein
MIRTILSFCALFGSLLFVSKWLHETNQPAKLSTLGGRPALKVKPSPAEIRTSAPSEPELIPERHDQATEPKIRRVSYEIDALEANDSLGAEARPQVGQRQPALGRVDDESAGESSSPGERDPSNATESQQPPSSAPTSPDSDLGLTPELMELRQRLRECLAYYYFRPENVAARSPWGAMHAMIAYGVDTELIAGTKRVNAIGYLCYNGVCNGQQLFYLSGGKLQTRIGPGVQGHPGQFLAMLAQSRVKTDYPIRIEDKDFTVADLIQHEKETCRPRTELTFKLISFMHYLKSDETWKSNDGETWDIPRLIKEELAQPIIGAACGGTHRMTGFSYTIRKREQRGEAFTGQWARAKKFVDDYHEYTFKLQNPDGSFSTDWFAGRNDFGPISKRLETTGHITEWLAFSLRKEQLVEPRMIKSVSYLTDLLLENPNEKWGIGPLGHGLHALALYDERIFGGKPGQRGTELAAVRKASVER